MDTFSPSVNTCSTSVEAGLKWKTIIDFSRECNLPLPTRFLEHCAEANNWLSFLVYSQVFSYDVGEVSVTVTTFWYMQKYITVIALSLDVITRGFQLCNRL